MRATSFTLIISVGGSVRRPSSAFESKRQIQELRRTQVGRARQNREGKGKQGKPVRVALTFLSHNIENRLLTVV